MNRPDNLEAVGRWLRENGIGAIEGFDPVGGGCISETGHLRLNDGSSLFLKLNADVPTDFFAAEAYGLALLARASSLRVPRVIHAGHGFLLLEDLGRGQPGPAFWMTLGEGLAALHETRHPHFGLERNNYCGATPQINTPLEDGWEFFARHRLLALGSQARDLELFEDGDLERLTWIGSRLSTWIPEQPAVLLHGDLWSGNVHCDKEGQPALIDPACYYGWAEAELAMTLLFGGFPATFYSAYLSCATLPLDWRDRASLYNLYHLLNHLVLFGRGYLGQVRQILNRFAWSHGKE